MNTTNPYLKFFTQLGGTVLAAVVAALADQDFSNLDLANTIVLAFTSASVLGAGNFPTGIWSKTKLYISIGGAVAVYIQSVVLTQGDFNLNLSQWLQIAIAILTAAGVYQVNGPIVTNFTNSSPPPARPTPDTLFDK